MTAFGKPPKRGLPKAASPTFFTFCHTRPLFEGLLCCVLRVCLTLFFFAPPTRTSGPAVFRRTGPPLCFLCGFATSLTVKGGSHPLSLAQRVKTTFAFVKGGFHPLSPAQSVETTFASVKGGFSPFEPGSKCQNLLSPHSPRASPALPRLRRFDPVHWVKPPSPRPSPGSSPVSPAPRPGFSGPPPAGR